MRLEATCLTESEIRWIHQSALEVLSKTGVGMVLPEALEILDGAGARVDRSSCRVRIDAGLVERCLTTIARKVELYGRGERKTLRVPEEGPFFGTWANTVRILDVESGERRPATCKDLVHFVQLVDGLENFDFSRPVLAPQDVPQKTASLHAWAITLQNTGKHIMGQAPGIRGTERVLEMCVAIAGTLDALRKKPFITFGVLTRPPLMWSNEALGGLLIAARNGIPFYLGAGPIAGSTGPVTLAGTLVQAHAELLGGIVLAQTVNPGAPMFYTSSCRVMDMASGNISMCSPEWFLFRVSLRQLGRFLGIPVWTGGVSTNAKIPDAQAGYEQGISAVAGGLGGDLIAGCTLESNKMTDMGTLVIGDEIISMVKRMMRGFELTPETLAVDVIDQVGPGGEYLGIKHTLKHFRKEIWHPTLSDRSTWSSWVKDGKKDTWERAKNRAKKVLAEHQPYECPKDQRREIERILERASL